MLNKLLAFIRKYQLIAPGDRVIAALSGGADSVALTFALYLLKEKLDFTLEAAHFNHNLRGKDSDADEAFVREFCHRYDIPLHIGSAQVVSGKKGLEAAARDARYAWMRTLPGKVATAHTADDNAETVLLHMIRGSGLKGLGGIPPVNGTIIRPMLLVTRTDVEDFLNEWCLSHVEDATNGEDTFQRNRIRHHVMPLLYRENPRIGENLSRMALGLRVEEDCLCQMADYEALPDVDTLKGKHPALRRRMLARFLKESGVREPEESHIAQAEALLYSPKPSAKANLPGGVTIARNYGRLEALPQQRPLEETPLPVPGCIEVSGYRVTIAVAEEIRNSKDTFTVCPQGALTLRSRRSGDAIRLSGGTKRLKKLFIDCKIPAAQRERIPVLCDELGILGVYGFGTNLDRTAAALPCVTVHIEKIKGA